jgi:two-component system, chemotaxis family, chemotaxis protein CheY
MTRLLLVEDDPDIRETLAEVFAEEGYEVSVAANGREALDQLRRRPPLPEIILLDLMMPLMDGWQFHTEQQKVSELAAIPVIVLSADGSAGDKARRIHAAGSLRKPLDVAVLLDMVERICTRA